MGCPSQDVRCFILEKSNPASSQNHKYMFIRETCLLNWNDKTELQVLRVHLQQEQVLAGPILINAAIYHVWCLLNKYPNPHRNGQQSIAHYKGKVDKLAWPPAPVRHMTLWIQCSLRRTKGSNGNVVLKCQKQGGEIQ